MELSVVNRTAGDSRIWDILIELSFLAFLLAGYYKGDPRLVGIPFDLTIVFFAASFLLIFLRFIMQPRIAAPAIPFILLFGLLAGFLLLSSVYSRLPSVGLEKGLRFLVLTGWGAIAPLFFMKEESFRRLPFYLIGFALVSAGDGVLRYLVSPNSRVYGFGSNYGSFSQFVAVAFPFAFVYLLKGKNVLQTIVSLAVCSLLIYSVMLSEGKAGILGIVLTVLLMPLFYQAPRKRKTLILVLFLVMALATLFLFSSSFQGTFTRFSSMIEGQDDRYELFSGALELWQSHLWIGSGAAGYAVLFPRVFPNPLEAYPHSLFLEVACEQGIVGLLLLFATIGYALTLFLKYRYGKDPQMFAALLAAFVSLIFFAIVSKSILESKIFFYVVGLMVAFTVLPGDTIERTNATSTM
ncbi:MAG: O-antigen ligase family protein [bacterium]